MRLNPRLFEACYFFARTAFAQGDAEKAISLYERANRVQPQDYQSSLLMAQIYDDLGRQDEARNSRRRGVRLVEDRLRLNPDDVRALYMGANGLVALGEMGRGLEWARRAARMDPDEPMVLYNVACLQALAGRTEEAFETLELAVRSGLNQKGWIEHDSNLDAVRGHPRYPALIDYLDRQASGNP